MTRKRKNIDVSETFGVEIYTDTQTKTSLKVPGFRDPGPNTPERVAGYRHNTHHIHRMCLAYMNGLPIALTGPTGSGKTKLAMDFMAGLNHEPIIASSSDENEVTDFLGARMPNENGGFPWNDGPVARSIRENRPLILDEMDRNRPGVLAKLNHVLEGSPLHIESTGEVLTPQPGWWFIATMNTRGHGDETGTLTSTLAQDQATLGRFVRLHVDYDTEAEKEVAGEVLGSQAYGGLLCQLFGDLRSTSVDCPLGTRQLVQFAHLWRSAGAPEPALEMVLTQAASEDEKTQEVIWNTFQSLFQRDQQAA